MSKTTTIAKGYRLTMVNRAMIKKYGLHPRCEVRWANKCEWEHLSRLAVLEQWPDIICSECLEKYKRTPRRKNRS